MAFPLPTQDLETRGGLPMANPATCQILSYSKSKNHTPWLTPLIMVTNIVVYAIVMHINNCPKSPAGHQGKCVPKFLGRFSFDKTIYGPSDETLSKVGALVGNNIDHEKWKLFVSYWLHHNILHLIVNSISLLIIGMPLEREFGQVRIGVIYILSGFGGSIFYAKLVLQVQNVCVSGPLFGLIGATLSELLVNLLSNDKSSRLWVVMSIILVNSIAIVRGPPDDIIGGFLTGCFLGSILLIRPQYKSQKSQENSSCESIMSQYDLLQIIYWLVSLILLIMETVWSFFWLFKGFH